jgi:hypothetical protein
MQTRGAAPRIRPWAAALLVALPVVLLAARCALDPEIAFLVPGGPAPWIAVAGDVPTVVQQWGRAEAPAGRFVRRFELEQVPERAVLEARAHGSLEVRVNGVPVEALASPPAPRRFGARADVAAQLRSGANEIEAVVRNRRGPPLFAARLALAGGDLASGPEWSAALEDTDPPSGPAGPRAAPAVLADDTRPHPSAAAGPSAPAALASRAAGLLALAALSLAAALALERASGREIAALPRLALAAVHVAWLWLFVDRFLGIPYWLGFDAIHHLEYVQILYSEERLPAAAEGWSTYHPPLFYGLAALVTAAAHQIDGERLALGAVKLLPFLCGLGNVWVAFGLARLLLPGCGGAQALAVVFTGVLPLNLYMAAYLSNEPLHALLLGLATLALARAFVAGPLGAGPGVRGALGAGALLGLALLAKLTAALGLVAAALALLAAPGPLAPRRRAARLGALVAPALLLSGWFYARGLFAYGRPVLGNWDLPGEDQAWWSYPGFHTPAYYLGFGTALLRPCFAGFRSYADALYSSLWADGWVGGQESVLLRPTAWDWEWMSVGCLLALPATALLAVGLARALRLAASDADPGRAAAFRLLVLQIGIVAFALFSLSVRLPYFGQARASYALGLVAPLALLFVLGAERGDALAVRAGGRPARLVFRAWLGVLLAVLYLGFAG